MFLLSVLAFVQFSWDQPACFADDANADGQRTAKVVDRFVQSLSRVSSSYMNLMCPR